MNDHEKEIILALAKCNMNVSEAARETYQHRNTVIYHIGQIKRKTGFDPYSFYDLSKLVEIAKEEKMKEVRICFEVQGLGVDENGNPCPVGMQFSIGEVSDEKYESIDYFEAMKNVKVIDLLRELGLKTFAANRSEDDFRLISPEEYDQKYGEGEEAE